MSTNLAEPQSMASAKGEQKSGEAVSIFLGLKVVKTYLFASGSNTP